MRVKEKTLTKTLFGKGLLPIPVGGLDGTRTRPQPCWG